MPWFLSLRHANTGTLLRMNNCRGSERMKQGIRMELTFRRSWRGKKAAKNKIMQVASMRARKGKMMQYLRKVPSTHVGNKYQFQFQGSGGAVVKHRKKESSIKAFAASHSRSEVSNNVALQTNMHNVRRLHFMKGGNLACINAVVSVFCRLQCRQGTAYTWRGAEVSGSTTTGATMKQAEHIRGKYRTRRLSELVHGG